MTDNNTKLKRLIKKHKLTRPRVAKLSKHSLSAVDSWLAPVGAKWRRNMPDDAFDLVMLRVEK